MSEPGSGGVAVQGYCPACSGQTLFLGAGGHVTCSRLSCPDPCAVSTMLEDRESQHILESDGKAFTVRHPLRERDDELTKCDLHQVCASIRAPIQAGRYRVVRDGSGWLFSLTAPQSGELL